MTETNSKLPVRRFVERSAVSLFALIGLNLWLVGCGTSAPAQPEPAKRMVYVDTATMKPLVHEVATAFPAIHPQTGKKTLQPALFCDKCQKWYPVPNVEQLNRRPGAGLCPKDKSPLTADGPWPDGSRPVPSTSK